jgi:preprotein translocase subunit SecF
MQLHFNIHNLIWFVAWCLVLLYASHMARVFRQKQIDIIGKWKWFFLFSGVLLAIGIISLLLPSKGLKLGLDFKGGTILEYGLYKPVTADAVRQVITPVSPLLQDALIQLEAKPPEIGETNAPVSIVLIRSQKLSQDEIHAIGEALQKAFGKVDLRQSQTIGPTIGAELKHSAIVAIVAALIIQLIYITLRFGWNLNYGLAADLALLHDVIMMVGLYAFFGREADSPFLAALLTVIGYSVMDSIVIFDRIRENLHTTTRESFESIVNKSVLQTMTRSINTLMTVLFTLLALYFFGGETLKNFAFALLIGVTSGAYSSIFIASPLLVIWEKWSQKREKQRITANMPSTNGKKAKIAVPASLEPITEEYPLVEASPEAISKRIPKRRIGRKKKK